jgi:hypothetical protein
MASITSWDESVPSGTSSIAQGDDDIRSFKSFFRSWVSQEHYTTDGSSTSAGEHKLGSARAFQLPLSRISGVANRAGQLSHDTTNNYLWVGSGSSISQVAGAAIGSVNTWSARQAYTAGITLGAETLLSVDQVTVALSVTTLAGSASTDISVAVAGGAAQPMAVSMRGPDGVVAYIQTSAYYEANTAAVRVTISNMSAGQIVIPAQTLAVSIFSFA